MTGSPDLPYRGDPKPLAIKASHVGRFSRACPAHLAMDVRPAVGPDIEGWWRRREPWPFLLGQIVDATTAIENGADFRETLSAVPEQINKSGLSLHPGAVNFVWHAVTEYLDWSEGRAKT